MKSNNGLSRKKSIILNFGEPPRVFVRIDSCSFFAYNSVRFASSASIQGKERFHGGSCISYNFRMTKIIKMEIWKIRYMIGARMGVTKSVMILAALLILLVIISSTLMTYCVSLERRYEVFHHNAKNEKTPKPLTSFQI